MAVLKAEMKSSAVQSSGCTIQWKYNSVAVHPAAIHPVEVQSSAESLMT